MKKIIASISFICYLLVTTGIAVNSHYCMKKHVSTHLFETKSKICGRCGMGMHKSKGCCHDEVKVVKLSQDQNKVPVTIYEIPAIKQIAVLPSDIIVASYCNIDVQHHFLNHSPPLLTQQDTYLQNCVFRI